MCKCFGLVVVYFKRHFNLTKDMILSMFKDLLLSSKVCRYQNTYSLLLIDIALSVSLKTLYAFVITKNVKYKNLIKQHCYEQKWKTNHGILLLIKILRNTTAFL